MTHYHIIGHSRPQSSLHFTMGYKLELFFYHCRQLIAFLICPELRALVNNNRYNLDYIIRMSKEHSKNMRGINKALAKIQKERKVLRRIIKENIITTDNNY